MNKPTFKDIILLNIQNLTNFPYIEKDFDALTDYGLLCKVVDKMNEVISNNDIQNQSINVLYDAFIELKDYVDNIDIQENVNIKLDEMASDGTLEALINSRLNLITIFNTVADMKNATLTNGMIVETLGYYSINDEGGSKYYIRTKTNNDVIDESFIINISNTLVAELIIENKVNIKQLGAKSFDGTTKYDIKDKIEVFRNYCISNLKKIELFIPSGIWYSSPVDIYGRGIKIKGELSFNTGTALRYGTIITSFEDNQDYIFSIGNINNYSDNSDVSNICFSTAEYDENYGIDSIKNIGIATVIFCNACYSTFDELYFTHINGCATKILNTWESHFKKLFYRDVRNVTGSIVLFATKDTTLTPVVSISACKFDYLMFEYTLGDLMQFETNCEFINNVIDTINFEDNNIYEYNNRYTYYDDTNTGTSVTHNAIIKLLRQAQFECVVNNIVLNNFSVFYYTENGTNYCVDSVIRCQSSEQYLKSIINNIHVIAMRKDTSILYNNENINYNSDIIVNNIMVNNSKYRMLFTVKTFPKLVCNNLHDGMTTGDYYNGWKPFYLTVNKKDDNTTHGLINTDTTARNLLKLATLLQGNTSYIYSETDKMKIRAKIPNGVTATLKISCENDASSGTAELLGTGSFKVYDLDLAAITSNNATYFTNEIRRMVISNNDTTPNIYLDSYRFI